VSVLEATMANLEALGHSAAASEQRVPTHHTPSRVLKWAAPAGGRTPCAPSVCFHHVRAHARVGGAPA
jgi:hypothetical protein